MDTGSFLVDVTDPVFFEIPVQLPVDFNEEVLRAAAESDLRHLPATRNELLHQETWILVGPAQALGITEDPFLVGSVGNAVVERLFPVRDIHRNVRA